MITLKTLPTATNQEVFDQVANHLLTQMKPSIDITDGRCVYLGENGFKCAAGCLIGKEEYDSTWEGTGWCDLSLIGVVPSQHSELIQSLQKLHDHTDPDDWEGGLMSIATCFNLEWNFNHE